jgi:hypothetical protein
MLSRRTFFGALGAAAAAVALPLRLPRWFRRRPDIVVKAGETLTLSPGEYGWIRVYGRLEGRAAQIQRLDIMDGGSCGLLPATFLTANQLRVYEDAIATNARARACAELLA